MPSPKHLMLQIVNYTVFMGLVWYFSFSPSYVRLTPDESMITLALSHAGKPVQECHRKSPEELAKLPPNMRVLEECPRERSPVKIEVFMDDKAVIDEIVTPRSVQRSGSGYLSQRQGAERRSHVKSSDERQHAGIRANPSTRSIGIT